MIETGLSDFHQMVVSVKKTNFRKLKPKIVRSRKYNKFLNECFREDFIEALSNNEIRNDNGFMAILNNHAPRKKKH